jgi:hypothetical protein
MVTVLEGYITEEQLPLVRLFLWEKDSIQRIAIKEHFLSAVENVCRVKRFTAGSRNSLKDVRKSQMLPNQLRKWLRQSQKTSKLRYYYNDGTSVSVLVEDMSRNTFFQVRTSHALPFISICDLFTDSSSYNDRLFKY